MWRGLHSSKETQLLFNNAGKYLQQNKDAHAHTPELTLDSLLIMCTYKLVCVSLCMCVLLYRKSSDWKKKASSILTNVCFWGANSVLKFLTGLFKTVAVCSCLSRTNAFHPHRQSCKPRPTLPRVLSAFTGVIMKCLFYSFFNVFPASSLCLRLQITE